jgi:hypothetical protein
MCPPLYFPSSCRPSCIFRQAVGRPFVCQSSLLGNAQVRCRLWAIGRRNSREELPRTFGEKTSLRRVGSDNNDGSVRIFKRAIRLNMEARVDQSPVLRLRMTCFRSFETGPRVEAELAGHEEA